MRVLEGTGTVDLTLYDEDDPRLAMRIVADKDSVDVSTTDHEGNETGPSFELTWSEIVQACRNYVEPKEATT